MVRGVRKWTPQFVFRGVETITAGPRQRVLQFSLLEKGANQMRKNRLGIELMGIVGALAFVLTVQGCGFTEEDCDPGDHCACAGVGECIRHCTGAGCAFSCEGIGECKLYCEEGGCEANASGTGQVSFECPAGGCKLTSSGAGDRTLICPGGNCQASCSGTGACKIEACTANCDMHCTGTGTCENSCKDPSCSTTIN